MYSVTVKLNVAAKDYNGLQEQMKKIAAVKGVTVMNWQYSELADNALIQADVHRGKVVKMKDNGKLGVITKVNPKSIVVAAGNGIQYTCPIEMLIDVAPQEFNPNDLALGWIEGHYSYDGYFGWLKKEGFLVVCFENRGKYDIIVVDTNAGSSGKSIKGLPKSEVERYVTFVRPN